MTPALWLLTFANLLNYLDRYVISSVAPVIEKEFLLTHTQTGFVMSAFMVGYMFTSPIFGWLGDRHHRPRAMAVSIAGWSLATAMSGAATNYFWLVVSRLGVGVGEAGYATFSTSYIRDVLRDDRKVNRALSIFYATIPVGAALGYLWGGWMATHYNWRWALYGGAIPGFFLFIFVWILKDPSRQVTQSSIAEPEESYWSRVAKLLKNKLYLGTILGYTAHTFALGGFAAWAPHYLSNALKVDLATASFKIGVSTCIAGIIGTFLGGKLADIGLSKLKVLDSTSMAKYYNRFCAYATLLAAPCAVWMLFAPDGTQFSVAFFLVQLAMFASIAPINTATLTAVASGLTAAAFAVQIFITHALGDVISPPLVGYLSESMPMNEAMLVLVVSMIFCSAFWWYTGRVEKETQSNG